MKLATLRLSNFQSFGEQTTELGLEEITYLIGPNGSGKTAALQALCRLFAFDPSLRRILRSDFHVPFNEAVPQAERQLWIEADFLFPELGDDEDNSTVAPHFGHMRLDEIDGTPRVRFRLTATMGLDGDIEESMVYVLDINADGSPLSTAQVPRSERNHIHVHYLPARRDPADHIAYGANALLGRMLRAVNWESERAVIKALTDRISRSLTANPSIKAFSTSLKTAWSALHKGIFFADPKLTFVTSEIEALLRHMSVSFTPGHEEPLVDFSRLSDGQKSMLYLSLVLSSQAIGRAALAENDNSFDVEKLRPPVLTVVAVEEPENSLSPHYLGRIVNALNGLVGKGDAQALIATHAPSMLRRVADGQLHPLKSLKLSAESMLRPHVVLDILGSFTLFATNKKKQRIKIICRYQQFEAANKIVERVLAGYPRKGLIWHFQGSGKSLLMVFAAQKLRMHAGLKNPTVLIVVDRIDLDTQITGTFTGADIPNLEKADTRDKLQQLLAQDVRKIIITTIFKFGEATGSLNDRSNIIALVDEAHRTQEGDLGRKMREALPNAFLFGLTGTPINRADRNTFYAFGADEDEKGYMSRYGFEESIRDGATLQLHFEPRLIDLHIDKAALDAAYKDLTGGLSDLDKDNLAKTAAKMAVLVKTPERIRKICEDIVEHFQTKVEPNGFKGQIVTFDRESCLLFKAELDKLLPPEATDIVMSVQAADKKEHPEYAPYDRSRDEEERLLDRFRDPADPLKLIIVTAKLLTGFDAPILQAMYLDKPLRDHTLLQAICRVNRTYSEQKTYGLIVDYLGIFDDVAAALEFDDQSVKQVVSNIQELKDELPEAMQKCLAFFPGIDRSVQGYEGLIAAQQCLPNNEVRDNFAAEYSVLNKVWEALSPDAVLTPFETDYRWLSQVYQSVQPSSGHGKLLWHSLGAKTIELIHKNVHVNAVRDDLDTLVLDADLLEAVLSNPDPKKAKEIEIKLKRRLRGKAGKPKFKQLSERLDALKDRFESGQINSVEFLKQLLQIAKETLQAEKEVPPEEDEDRGKAALTELFNEVKTTDTPVVVERVVADIDEIVRLVRFPGWQGTQAGEREVKKALRKALFKYKLHADEELFEKAFGYVREYY